VTDHSEYESPDPYLIELRGVRTFMQHDPFAHLNYEQIQAAEKKYRAAHPFLWWVAEAIVFVRDPRRWLRNWRRRRAIGYRD
jgi:hypothetical protein